ncbi:hypothetical protein [Chryseobacterium caseinilyticum]|uniref:Uncharacterized protein n=1 Tax=Chryseobacterium caseinilyticum TaxID=2771428 RepID=A0ABR8ZG59_9FLAO|nr:hypothetical protein [Chryseobacterium caseinilyticum]MBD8083681.1 hypothetical protein [Chryseobacterium caseinilyticum]
MMKLNFTVLTVFFFNMMSFLSYSQTSVSNKTINISLPIKAIVDLEPSTNVSLTFISPAEAGNPLTISSLNATKWINYTSIVSSIGLNRKITARISEIIPGINIRLSVANATGSGGGVLGTSTATNPVTLSQAEQIIITGIRGAYTGDGINNGHQINLSASVQNYADIVKTDKSISITYTISE